MFTECIKRLNDPEWDVAYHCLRESERQQFGSRSGSTVVGPDLGPNCLQRSSVDDKIVTNKEIDNVLLPHPFLLAYPYTCHRALQVVHVPRILKYIYMSESSKFPKS